MYCVCIETENRHRRSLACCVEVEKRQYIYYSYTHNQTKKKKNLYIIPFCMLYWSIRMWMWHIVIFSWFNRFGSVITITNDFPIKKTYYHCCSFSLFHIVSRIRAASWCLHCASSSKFTYIDVKLCIRKIYLMKHFIDCLFMANVVVLLLLSAADGIRKPKLKYIFYWNKFINIIIV